MVELGWLYAPLLDPVWPELLAVADVEGEVLVVVVASAVAESERIAELHPANASPARRRVNKIEFFIGRLNYLSTDPAVPRRFRNGGRGPRFSAEWADLRCESPRASHFCNWPARREIFAGISRAVKRLKIWEVSRSNRANLQAAGLHSVIGYSNWMRRAAGSDRRK